MLQVITGANGLIGAGLTHAMAEQGMTVLAVTRQSSNPTHPKAIAHVASLENAQDLLPAQFHGTEFQLIHLAWGISSRTFSEQIEHLRRLTQIVEHWHGKGLKRILFPGSAAEFGNYTGSLATASAVGKLQTPYGLAKHFAYLFLEDFCAQHALPVTYLRPFVVYGPGQSGHMLIPHAIHAARNHAVAQFTDGNQIRDFVFIDDVCQAFQRAAALKTDGFNEINIGTGKGTAVKDVLKHIAAYFSAEDCFKLGAIPRRSADPEVQVADTERAKNILGWVARTSLEEGLKRSCE